MPYNLVCNFNMAAIHFFPIYLLPTFARALQLMRHLKINLYILEKSSIRESSKPYW